MIRPPKCRAARVKMLDVLIALAVVTSVVKVRPRGVRSPPPCAAAYFLIPDKPGRGRPFVGAMPPAELAKLDHWISRQKNELTRPEAIRRLVEHALDNKP